MATTPLQRVNCPAMSDKIFKEKQDQKVKLRVVCANCQKPITPNSKVGSFTSFLFAENRCQCSKSELSQVVESQPSGDASPTSTTLFPSTPTQLEKPDMGERYEVLELIGQGGMGAVWKVRDHAINKTLAIKVLRKELAGDKLAVKRFQQEAQAASCLTQANLVAVYGTGTAKDDSPYLIMDFLEGENLESLLAREVRLPAPQALDIASQIADALAHAHAKGIVHRDLKPSNIILTKTEAGNDIVKIVDFGIAKVMPSINEQTNNLTQTGDLFGSPLYMSPEQCKGDPVDSRSDIYAFGCVLYEMLSGRTAFAADNPIKTILMHLNEAPKPLNSEGIPEGVTSIIDRCLEKHPGSRYQSIEEILQDLSLAGTSKGSSKSKEIIFRRIAAAVIDGTVLGSIALVLCYIMLLYFDNTFVSGTSHLSLSAAGFLSSFSSIALVVYSAMIVDCICLIPSEFMLYLTVFLIMPIYQAAGHTVPPPNMNTDMLAQTLHNSSVLTGLIALQIFLIILNWLYHAISESSGWQGTLGKKLTRLKVSSENGRQLSFGQASTRHIAKSLIPVQSVFLWLTLPLSCFPKLSKLLKRGKLQTFRSSPIHDLLTKCRVKLR